jgi:nitronate monooxygenase
VSRLDREALGAVLNELLEAERAGARVLLEFLEDYPRHSPTWEALREVQQDEAHNCVLLGQLLARCGVGPSGATGDFLRRALAIRGRRARLEYLNRGQAWVARKIDAALPAIEDGETVRVLAEMSDSHRRNVAACDALARSIDD